MLDGAITDTVSPPDDPAERLKWAKGLLRYFSGSEGHNAVSAAELRAMARRIIGDLHPSVQSEPNRTHRGRADTVDYVHNLYPPFCFSSDRRWDARTVRRVLQCWLVTAAGAMDRGLVFGRGWAAAQPART